MTALNKVKHHLIHLSYEFIYENIKAIAATLIITVITGNYSNLSLPHVLTPENFLVSLFHMNKIFIGAGK